MQKSRCTVIFTGAGVSAESGVPTFRGNDGLWKKYRAEDLATPEAFTRNPKLVWEWYDFRRSLLATKSPNAAHLQIAEWERQLTGVHVVTQNVDGLHQRAGSSRVYCLHGDIWTVCCSRCGRSEHNMETPLRELPPRCGCGGMQRPGVVWFGESLPHDVWKAAESLCAADAELMFVVGTSALVHPAAGLPFLAKSRGCFIVEVNTEPTALTGHADVFFQGKAGEILGRF